MVWEEVISTKTGETKLDMPWFQNKEVFIFYADTIYFYADTHSVRWCHIKVFHLIFRKSEKVENATFNSNQCKEIEENNRMGKTRDLFKKIRDTKVTFHAKMGTIHYGEQCGDSLKKTGNRTAIWPSNPTAGHTHWGNQNWKRHIYSNVHCRIVYNS